MSRAFRTLRFIGLLMLFVGFAPAVVSANDNVECQCQVQAYEEGQVETLVVPTTLTDEQCVTIPEVAQTNSTELTSFQLNPTLLYLNCVPVSTEEEEEVGYQIPSNVGNLNKVGTLSLPIFIGRFGAFAGAVPIAGSFMIILVIYGGALIMTSAGNAEQTKKGRMVIVWTIIGFMFILLSYALARFLFSAFV